MTDFSIRSWNVCGLADPTRIRIVRSWLNGLARPLDIICIQELRAQPGIISLQLQNIFPQGTAQIDCLDNNSVGCAVVAASHITVLDKGSRGDGSFTWIRIKTEVGLFLIASIYAPAN
jgi:exonuclease III